MLVLAVVVVVVVVVVGVVGVVGVVVVAGGVRGEVLNIKSPGGEVISSDCE